MISIISNMMNSFLYVKTIHKEHTRTKLLTNINYTQNRQVRQFSNL